MIKQTEIQSYWELKSQHEKLEEKYQAIREELKARLHKQEEQEEGALALYFKPFTKTITRYKEVVDKMRQWLMGEGKMKSVQKLETFLEESSKPMQSEYLDIRQVEIVQVTRMVKVK
jgi:hypothetical protein